MILHHIGIACKNIEKKLCLIKSMHPVLSCSEIVFDPLQDARLCMVDVKGSHKMELIEGKPVENLVEKGIHLYHLCYEVNNIHDQIEQMTANGGMQITPVKKAILFNNRPVVFFYTELGIIEFL